ncbi:TraB/GumN family protein [uncultured Ferrimonas sp.]|uniref:TraB/GumN family protein n=1 Tax=uncultured Ferrimonas sp. TaxID=432640 RepID=UPI00261D9A07|nr:TraB/GumN family protein [uncultured Ferrimonas sp.]
MIRFLSITLMLSVLLLPSRLLAAPSDRPLFYQLQLGQQQGWLLGSIHVGKADFYPMAAIIERAIVDAEALVLEANPNDPQLPQLFAQYALAKQPLPAALAKQIQSRCDQLQLQCNLDLAPWLLSSQIAVGLMAKQGYSAPFGVESQLSQRFANRPLLELEGMTQQMQLFDSLSRDANLQMVQAAIAEVDIEQMVLAWRQGDRAALQALFLQEYENDELMQLLLVQRNQQMAKKTKALLQEQSKLLVAVGAAHLLGESSVVALLRQQGVTVTDCWRSQCRAVE